MPDKDIVEEQISQEAVGAEDIKTKAEEVKVEAIQPETIQEDVSTVDFETMTDDIGLTAGPQMEAGSGEETVTVQPVKFASFESLSQAQGETNKNLDLLMDIKLQLTVELGRTELPIKKVLELTRGSIIELEKVAGEPVELYANGKLVAHGEVVVIEDNFGLRITSITEAEERLKGI